MTQAPTRFFHQGAVVAGAKLDPGALRGRVHLMLLANLRQLFTHILLELLELLGAAGAAGSGT